MAMAPSADRRRSADVSDDVQPSKKLKTAHLEGAAENFENAFTPNLFDPAAVAARHAEYCNSQPYKHSVFSALIEPTLLQNVQNEILKEITFTEKETDIYKVHQTGDLASLSYLSSSEISRLPSVLRLRNALYSPVFRQLMRDVTGCGPLSGMKQDMSVNSYRKGCHLLNHDDVIGTRRVSYILYMPIGPQGDKTWKPEWGGALELYPVHAVGNSLQPDSVPSLILPPSWNQFTFFEVQPGHSFHSVEEVIVGTTDDGIQRLSISGWFHAAQEGEEGYDPATDSEEARQNSSLSQLSTTTSDLLIPFESPLEPTPEPVWLTNEELADLTPYINPSYLQPSTLSVLAAKFAENSSIQLHRFLKDDVAENLQKSLAADDESEGLGSTRPSRIPPHSSGTQSGDWSLAGPPHKQRFCVLTESPKSPGAQMLQEFQTRLFTSRGFVAWLRFVTTLVPLAHHVQARRFRPGLDYTLARAKDDAAMLDVTLGLTPSSDTSAQGEAWEEGNLGAWECYMAPHDEEDDPAVYRSGSRKKGDMEDDEDDEDTLLTVQAGFNQLLLVLRDEGVMRFVKYVSALAPGSRWDVAAEYSVGMVEEDDEENEDPSVV